ncbi:MAG: hypothetical protein FWC39_01720 [Bacteroidetes bacterium]|nr:hypothetical protein [Bacteroidota bacterium]
MKKIISTLLLAALGSSLFAQGDVFDATFLTFSYQAPILKWGKLEDRTSGDNLKKFYQNQYDAKTFGMALESGTTFYFHSFEPTDGLKFAIVWDFLDLGMNLFRFDDWVDKKGRADDGNKVKSYDLFANYSMNVGPMITFSPFQGFCIDLYGKWRPTVGVNAYRLLFYDGVKDRIFTNENEGVAGKDKLIREEVRIGGSVGTISCGLNIRYRFVMTGIEYITGKMTYASTDYLPQQKMWNQMVRFKLGLVFGDALTTL